MNKVSYYFAALILGFSMSAHAQSPGASTKFTPSLTKDEVSASNEMAGAGAATQTMSQRAEVLTPRLIPNPWVTMEPTFGYVNANLSGIAGVNGASVDAVNRMQGGAGVLIGRGMWQGETGLIYAQRGGAMNNALDNSGTYKVNMDFTTTYLDVPMMARFSFPHSSRSHFFARAGVIVGFLVDAKYDVKANPVSIYSGYAPAMNETGKDAKDLFNSTDFRGALGVGYDWKFSRNVGWIVQADFQESLAKINTSKFFNDMDIYNMSLILSTGVSIKM